MSSPAAEDSGCADPYEIKEPARAGCAAAISGFSHRRRDERSLAVDVNCGNLPSMTSLKIELILFAVDLCASFAQLAKVWEIPNNCGVHADLENTYKGVSLPV
jgi:hypothetical protein